MREKLHFVAFKQHVHSLISAFIIHSGNNDSLLNLPHETFKLVFVAEQAGLIMIWLQNPEDLFSRIKAHIRPPDKSA